MFDFNDAQQRAERRLQRTSSRRRRSDAGRSRLPPAVLGEFRALSLGSERPPLAAVRRRISGVCARHGLPMPSRAGLYNAFLRIPGHTYRTRLLPRYVGEALYNLAPDSEVEGRQLAFYCFNYGSLAAVCFAAGLPWLDLYQAAHLGGWRPRSYGLLQAALRARGIR